MTHAQQVITAVKQGDACCAEKECTRKLKGSQIGLTWPLCGTTHKSFGSTTEPHKCDPHTQQPSRSSPDALMNKATNAMLPCKDNATMGANHDDSDPKLDNLAQPKSCKQRHDDTACFMSCIWSMRARRLPQKWSRANLIFLGCPTKQGWVAQLMHRLG